MHDSNTMVDVFGLSECGMDKMPDPYKGVKEASNMMKELGLPRNIRKQVLQSFESENIIIRKATANEFGLRYHDNGKNAWPKGRYLFETFPATRSELAVKMDWNEMTYISQFKIKEGTTIFEGRASSQGLGLPGGKVQKYILDSPDTALFDIN
ncbi:hypothetical protein A9G48_00725 [Gilliamella sp. wkB18]|nr:hypothetical protein A9G48_00725 [Gilliamella apicola]